MMELQNERLFDARERVVRRWLLPLLIGVVVVGFPAMWFGPAMFARFQEARLLRLGRAAVESDPVRAVIFMRRVLAINRDNIDAMRTLAEIAERHAPSESAGLRERVSQLAPDSYDDARAWAVAALRRGLPAHADEAYALMSKAGAPSAELYELGGDVSLANGRVQEARERYSRALELNPRNDNARLQVATIDIFSSDLAARDRARESLEALRQNPVRRHAATRALIGDKLERGDAAGALELAKDFVGDGETTFQDRLQYLAILRSIEGPSGTFVTTFQKPAGLSLDLVKPAAGATFAGYLSELQERARSVPADVAALITFLNARGLSVLASEWAATLPPEMLAVPPVAPALAESYRQSVNWPRLQAFVTDANWGYSEFLRAAFSAFVKREVGDRGGAAADWATAIRLADYRQEKLAVLERLTASWDWKDEWEEIVWVVARSSKRPREALEALADYYRGKRDTQKLFTVWSRLLDLDPADLQARKHWAQLSLLLGNDKFRTGTMVQEIYRERPDDPEIAATYALLLHQRMRSDEAVAAMERLGVEQLRIPRTAAYYSIVLFGTNRRKEAAEFVARAKDAPLLREEQELVDKVRRMLD